MNQEIKKILPVVFLIVAAGLGWLSWQSYLDILIAQNQIKESKDKIAVLNKTVEKINEFIYFTKKNPEIADKLNIILPDSGDKPNMVSSLASAAFFNGLLLKNINFTDPPIGQIAYNEDGTPVVAENEFKTENITLVFSGTYSSLKNFLIFAGKSLKLTDINSIDFKKSEAENAGAANEGSQTASYDFTIGLKTYYLSKNDNVSAESKISEASGWINLSFFQGKQFMELVSPDNYNIDITDAGDRGNKNIF